MGWLQDWLTGLKKQHGTRTAEFVLLYGPGECSAAEATPVGYLTFADGVWEFRYSDEYRRRPDLRPIEGFDDEDAVYRSETLFPFFAVRVPNTERPDIRKVLEEKRIASPDLVDMLRLFGTHVANAPDLCLTER